MKIAGKMSSILKQSKPSQGVSSSRPVAALNVFGKRLVFDVPERDFETNTRLQGYIETAQKFISSRSLPIEGHFVDTGAGAGAIALAFASAFPRWQVTAFEGDPELFSYLESNAERLNLKNITCVNATFHKDGVVSLSGAAFLDDRKAKFSRIAALPPLYAPHSNVVESESTMEFSIVSPKVLHSLAPDVIRLHAPFVEKELISEIERLDVFGVFGESFEPLPSCCLAPRIGAGISECYIEHKEGALRKNFEDHFANRRIGLDIVVAMYNTHDFIVECVDSLLADGNASIRVLVVDDGSTDGSAELVENTYKDVERVHLLKKANGGCASARNFGREYSDATHIAFIDADDRVDACMFSNLFEVAQHTGAYIVEGEFKFFEVRADGEEFFRDSYEANSFKRRGGDRVGDIEYTWIDADRICYGQPTIWRRVHRRDFLDRKDIWFPEHVRAFDDQIFQFLIGQLGTRIAHVHGNSYHYRQHAGQDIKQGDERHFYSFNMFKDIGKRSIEEGWNNLHPYYTALLNTMKWSFSGLRPDLKDLYLEASAKFLAMLTKTFGYVFTEEELGRTGMEGLYILYERSVFAMRDVPVNYGHIHLEDYRWQPEFIRMMNG